MPRKPAETPGTGSDAANTGHAQSEPAMEEADADGDWEFRPSTLVRFHRSRRRTMFAPDRCSDPPPIPLNYIDLIRITRTDLENQGEKDIEDVWDGSSTDVRKVSEWRTGETVFHRFFREPQGYRVAQGRLTRIQKHSVRR